MRAKRFSTSPREKPGFTTQLQWECGIPTLSLPLQASSVTDFSRPLRVETISTLCSGLNILLRVLVNSTASLTSENELPTRHFLPHIASRRGNPVFFSIINMCCTSAPSRFGCWYRIHNGCQKSAIFPFVLWGQAILHALIYSIFPAENLLIWARQVEGVMILQPRMWNTVRGGRWLTPRSPLALVHWQQ